MDGKDRDVEHRATETLNPADLKERGLLVDKGQSIVGDLIYERPAWVLDPRRIKDCTLGAFSLINGWVTTSMFRCRLGRYAQVGEQVILGPPEHPMDHLSTHPFTFTRPRYLPNLYQLPDFVRLAPEDRPGPSYVDSVPDHTVVGHDTYVGAGSFVSRGVTIGDGAVIGARAVVTRDVPPYAIVAGVPARVIRLRFPEKTVERLLRVQWWRYDLAPHKQAIDFSRIDATLDYIEDHLARGDLDLLRPDTWRVRRSGSGFTAERLPAPLF